MKERKKRKILIQNKKIKFLITILVIFITLGFTLANKAFASTVFGDVVGTIAADSALAVLYYGAGPFAIAFVIGIKLLIIVLGWVLQLIGAAIIGEWGIEGIIFSGIDKYDKSLVSVNFFKNINEVGTIGEFAKAIAKWYYILRFISAAILLVILIYIGIRMALATVGKEQAKYKQWLVNWVVSLALLFLLDYIMAFTFTANEVLLNIIWDAQNSAGATTAELMGSLSVDAIIPGITGILAAFTFSVLSIQIFVFLIMYVKRLVTVAFLMMISPLICITYSIDKLGDGKAQALNEWLKEFIYNVLMQPFHCIIYVSLMGAVLDLVTGGSMFAPSSYFLAVFIIFFMKNAEKIIRQIFHFQPQTMQGMSDSNHAMMNAVGTFGKIGTAAGSGIIAFKNSGGFDKMKENIGGLKNAHQTKKEFTQSGNKSKDGQYFESYKDYVKSGKMRVDSISKYHEEVEKKKREKETKKFNKSHGTKYENYDQMIAEETKKENLAKAEKFRELGKGKDTYDKKYGEGSYDRDQAELKEAYDKKYGKGSYNADEEAKKDGKGTTGKDNFRKKRKDAIEAIQKGEIEGVSLTEDDTKKNVHDYVTTHRRSGKKLTFKGNGCLAKRAFNSIWTYTKDTGTDKIATNMAINGFAMMASGIGFGLDGAQGAISVFQTVKGFTKPLLENSAKTIEEDGKTRLDKAVQFNKEYEGMDTKGILTSVKSQDSQELRKDISDTKKEIKEMADTLKESLGISKQQTETMLLSFAGRIEQLLRDDKFKENIDLSAVAASIGEQCGINNFGSTFDGNEELQELVRRFCGFNSTLILKQQVDDAEKKGGYTVTRYASQIDKRANTATSQYEIVENAVLTERSTENNTTTVSFTVAGRNTPIKIELEGKITDEASLKYNPEITRILDNYENAYSSYSSGYISEEKYKAVCESLEKELKKETKKHVKVEKKKSRK